MERRLLEALHRDHAATIEASRVCPPFKRRASRLLGGRVATNVDRGMNRLVDYARHAGRLRHAHDVFHVVDHSYAQLVHRLPQDRTVVTCHDLDTFRSLLEPREEPRALPFRAMTTYILNGLRQAACVTCDTAAVRDELVARQLVTPERVVVAPLGVGEEFRADPDPDADRDVAAIVGRSGDGLELLHVGSAAPRKRIDVLLKAYATVREAFPTARLVRVGGPFTREQAALVADLGLTSSIVVTPRLDDRTLSALYRRAAVVVLPSEREGFGLPLAEALRCGAPVVASSLGALREVGGDAPVYVAPGDDRALADAITNLLRERDGDHTRAEQRRTLGIAHASRFSWTHFARQLAAIYHELHRAGAVAPARGSAACRA
jgi:glycosyltransferase involved in cell wall biosynthesis